MSSGFSSFSEFAAMGNHGFYVWLAYGVGVLVFAFLLLEPVWRRRQLLVRLRAFYRREQLDAQAARSARNSTDGQE